VPRRVKFPFLFLLVCLLLSPIAARADLDTACLAAPPDHRLLTGQSGLNYDQVGRAIVIAYNAQHLQQEPLVACPDDGSIESVQLLSEGRAAFAIVQSDVAHAAWFHHPVLFSKPPKPPCTALPCKFPQGQHEIRLIVPMFTEAVHVLVRPHLYISRVADLRGYRIWVGKQASGDYLTTERVLAAAGLKMSDVELVLAQTSSGPCMDTLRGALEALQQMDPALDAIIYTGAVPTRDIQAALAPPDGANINSEIHFVPLSVGMVSQLSNDSSYVETMIRKNDYGPGIPDSQGVATVGVEALFVTSDDPAMDTVALSMVSFLAANMHSIRAQLPSDEPALKRLALVDLPTRTSLLKRYFFRPARYYFFRDPAVLLHRVLWVAAGIAIFLFILFCWKRKKIGPHIMKEPLALFAFLGFVVAWALGAFSMWLLERHVNGDFAGIASALGSTVWYALPFSGKTAMTAYGQVTIKIVQTFMALLLGGAVWPYGKKFLVERIWRPVARWLRGGHLFARHNHTAR
jgi:TRAP transporter TAXI family solute receptor